MEQHIEHYNNIDESSDEELEDSSWMDILEKEENDLTTINGFKATALQTIDIADRLTLQILEKFDTILETDSVLVKLINI